MRTRPLDSLFCLGLALTAAHPAWAESVNPGSPFFLGCSEAGADYAHHYCVPDGSGCTGGCANANHETLLSMADAACGPDVASWYSIYFGIGGEGAGTDEFCSGGDDTTTYDFDRTKYFAACNPDGNLANMYCVEIDSCVALSNPGNTTDVCSGDCASADCDSDGFFQGTCSPDGGIYLEICSNGVSDDCDFGLEIDEEPCVVDDVKCNGLNDEDPIGSSGIDEFQAISECNPCGRHAGKPVDLMTRSAFVGPHVDVSVETGLPGAPTITVSRMWESDRAARDNIDSSAAQPGGQVFEKPEARIFGPGFRSAYSDRLIFHGVNAFDPNNDNYPRRVTYVGYEETAQFYEIGGNGTVAGTYKPVPGNPHALTNPSPGVWRLQKSNGDVFEFASGPNNQINSCIPSTYIHHWREPCSSSWPGDTFRYSARLKYIYPQNLTRVRIAIQHEQDGPIAAACNQLVDGIAGTCNLGRGLPVTVIAQWNDGGTWRDGRGIVFRYKLAPNDFGHKYQFLVTDILAYAELADGLGEIPLVQYTYDETQRPFRLARAASAVGCSPTQNGCTIAEYEYDGTSPRLSAVKRFGANTSASPVEVHEETFSWSGSDLVEHKSPGTLLQFSSSSPSRMTWLRNGASESTKFNSDGMPVQCDSGACGDPTYEGGYVKLITTSRYVVGKERHRNKDGTYVFRRLNSRGQVEVEMDVAPTTATSDPSWVVTTTGSGDEIAFTDGAPRTVKRFYYTDDGRLWISAELADTASTITSPVFFPARDDPNADWAYVGPVASRPEPDVTLSMGNYRVRIVDADSDLDGNINELGDYAEQRLWDYGANPSDPGKTDKASTTIARTAMGQPSQVKRTFGTLNGTTHVVTLDYNPINDANVNARSRGRLKNIAPWRDPALSSSTLTLWELCITAPVSPPFAIDGTVSCSQQPMSPYPLVATVGKAFSGGWRQVTTTFTANSTQLLQTFVRESGAGHRVEVGRTGGNRKVFARGTASELATSAMLLHTIRELDGTSVLGQEVVSFPLGSTNYGFPTKHEVFTGTSTLIDRTSFASVNEDGRVGSVQRWKTAATSLPATTFTFTPDDTVDTVTEPDGQVSDRTFNGLGIDLGRLRRLARGTSLPAANVVAEYRYTRRGLLSAVANPALGVDQATFAYNGFDQVQQERLPAAGIKRTYFHSALGRVSEMQTTPISTSTPFERVRYTYDGLDRLLCVSVNAGCVDPEYLYVYDAKMAPYLGDHNVGGRAIRLSSDNQAGRLAFVVDRGGGTFYEYDPLGRVIAVVRHEGPLPTHGGTFTPSLLVETKYTYNTDGELTAIKYPSGSDIAYTYEPGVGQDKPWKITLNGITVAWKIGYDGLRRVRGFYRDDGGSLERLITRDLSGRITDIDDTGLVASDVSYTYDDDGDLTLECDNSANNTWLTVPAAAGGVCRAYSYEAWRDVLDEWVTNDLGAANSMQFYGSGRRQSHTYAGTQFSTYMYDTTYPERLRKRDYTGGSSITTEAQLVYNTFARATVVDYNEIADPPVNPDVSLTYGPLGNTRGVTTTAGYYDYLYDHRMRRVKKTNPVVSDGTWWRFGLGSEPLEEKRKTGSTIQTTEFIFLDEDIVASRHVEGSTLRYVLTDRMGTPRKLANSTAVTRRLIMDSWGAGTVTGGDSWYTFARRYPGQQFDAESGLINNRWRSFVPRAGVFTSAEPRHQEVLVDLGALGPQAYTAVDGNPQSYVDPDGDIFRLFIRGAAGAYWYGRHLTRHQALQARKRGEDVVTSSVRKAKALDKDVSCQLGGTGQATRVEIHPNVPGAMPHTHAQKAKPLPGSTWDERFDGHTFIDPLLAGVIFTVLDADGSGDLDAADASILLVPIPPILDLLWDPAGSEFAGGDA